jgi:hypothetical protein
MYSPSVAHTLKRNLSRERIKITLTAATTVCNNSGIATAVNVFDGSLTDRDHGNTERLKRVSSSSSISSNSKRGEAVCAPIEVTTTRLILHDIIFQTALTWYRSATEVSILNCGSVCRRSSSIRIRRSRLWRTPYWITYEIRYGVDGYPSFYSAE